MCQFNFLLTNEPSDDFLVKSIASEIGLNYSKRELNIIGFHAINAFLTTRTSCDCGSVLGKNYRENSSEPDWQKEKKKLERKKFSNKRTELLLEQRRNEFAERNSEAVEKELRESRKWIEFIHDPRLKKQLSKIGILYHQFSGRLEDEKIKIGVESQISSNKVNVEFLRNIQEDEIVWVQLK